MKKILIFAESYLPGFKGGGPVVSISNLVDLIEDEYEILVCTKNHDFGEKTPYKNIISDSVTHINKHKILYLSSDGGLALWRAIRSFKPDVIYLNSFFSRTTQIVRFLNICFWRKPLLVAPRGELLHNSLGIKKWKKKLYLSLFKTAQLHKNLIFHSTDSIETESLEKMFGIDRGEIIEIPNAPRRCVLTAIAKRKGELRVVFISRICAKKNLHFALNILRDVTKNITFDIYGPLEDQNYWAKCQEIIKNLPPNITVAYNGSLEGTNIIETMRRYHVFLFPTLSENYGHVIVEAMQAGLVPIISDQTPWENLQEKNAGWDINLDNYGEYTTVLENLFHMDPARFSELSQSVINFINSRLTSYDLRSDYINCFKAIG
jgi:glycosyltransferase involved in cell wall biosynthesis